MADTLARWTASNNRIQERIERLARDPDGRRLNQNPLVQRPSNQAPWLPLKPSQVQGSVRRNGIQLGEPRVQRDVIFFQQFTRPRCSRHGVAFRCLRPFRKYVATDPIAEIIGARIRRIFPPARTADLEGVDHLALADREQRAEPHLSVRHCLHGPRRGHPARATAACEAHEHRLSDVVLLVSEPQHVRVTFEKTLPRSAGFGFARGTRSVFPFFLDQLYSERAADSSTELRVRPRLRAAELVIKMQRADPTTTLGPVRPDQEQRAKRIRPAGKCD